MLGYNVDVHDGP